MKVKLITIIVLCLLNIASSHALADSTIVLLRYYSQPVNKMEWQIVVFRQGASAYVQLEGYQNKHIKRPLTPERYKSFWDIMNRELLWKMDKNDQVYENSAYYELYYQYKGISRKIKIDPLAHHIGKMRGVPVVIRTIINYARISVPD